MALLTKAPRGTQDLLPAKAHRFQYIEKVVAETAACFGFYDVDFSVLGADAQSCQQTNDE